MSDINYPKTDFLKRGHKKKLTTAEQSVKDFNSLIQDKTHKDNQTQAYENNIKHILNSLLVGANDLENDNPGEGIYSLIVLALKTNLELKNKIIDLEKKLKDLNIKIKKSDESGR